MVKISERRACGLLMVVRGTCRYEAAIRQANDELRQKLRELAMVRRRFGYRRLHAVLRREGWTINHKRTTGFAFAALRRLKHHANAVLLRGG